jgi:hypothetical protein
MSICGYCGYATKKTLSKCSKCKLIHYCNKDCQKNDWSRHKKECCKIKSPTTRFKLPQSGDIDIITKSNHEELLSNQKKANEYISSTQDFDLEKRFETNFGSMNVFISLIQENHISIEDLRKVCEKVDFKNSDLWILYKEICNQSYSNTSKILIDLLNSDDFMDYKAPVELVNYFRKPDYIGSVIKYIKSYLK